MPRWLCSRSAGSLCRTRCRSPFSYALQHWLRKRLLAKRYLWTNAALERLTSRPLANASEASSLEGSTPASNRESYRRAKDPKWYGRQLQPLREELAKIDADLRTLMQARKSGNGATGTVAVEQEPEGVTTEG